jgi:hypothetical protein
MRKMSKPWPPLRHIKHELSLLRIEQAKIPPPYQIDKDGHFEMDLIIGIGGFSLINLMNWEFIRGKIFAYEEAIKFFKNAKV